jgi:hypothetical protein
MAESPFCSVTNNRITPPPWKPIPLEIQAVHEDLERLGDRISELSAQIQVATHHLLVMIREFDSREGRGGGFLSCAHWLNWRTGLGIGAAREKVRVARALGELPQISEAMRRGEVSYSKVRALTRVATSENEGRLLDFAKVGSAAHLDRLVRSWRRVDRIQEAERDSKRRSSRTLVAYFDEDGMLVVRGRLEPETGAIFLRALEVASDRLYERDRQAPDVPPGRAAPFEHRRADAIGLIAESALAANLDPGTRADRYQVVVHVDASVLEEPAPDETGQPGMAMLEDAHWAAGGETKLNNLLLLCRRHHVAVHEEGYRVEVLADGQARFFHPLGWEIKPVPQAPCIVDHSQSVLAPHLMAAGVQVGPRTGSATCYSGPIDYGLALDDMMAESSPLTKGDDSNRWTDTPPRERRVRVQREPCTNGPPAQSRADKSSLRSRCPP